MVFLLTLASGKRRSEIHAIERNSISWPEDKSQITLRVIPEFIAKTQLSADVGSLQPIVVKSLSQFLSAQSALFFVIWIELRKKALSNTKDFYLFHISLVFVGTLQGLQYHLGSSKLSAWPISLHHRQSKPIKSVLLQPQQPSITRLH